MRGVQSPQFNTRLSGVEIVCRWVQFGRIGSITFWSSPTSSARQMKKFEQNGAKTLLHTYYDDARQRGLPPHHAINAALGKLSKLQMAGAKDEEQNGTGNRGTVRP